MRRPSFKPQKLGRNELLDSAERPRALREIAADAGGNAGVWELATSPRGEAAGDIEASCEREQYCTDSDEPWRLNEIRRSQKKGGGPGQDER